MWGIKTQHFHDFWIVDPCGTLIYGFKHTRILLNIERKDGNDFRKILYLVDPTFWKIITFWNFGTDSDKTGTDT